MIPICLGRLSACSSAELTFDWRFIDLLPQLRFINIHQLFRIQYTLFELDTVNIYCWWCISLCRVYTRKYSLLSKHWLVYNIRCMNNVLYKVMLNNVCFIQE